jgi:hypothetical protein
VVPTESIESIDSPSTNYSFYLEDSTKLKYSKMNVSGELKLSALCGLVEVSGSAKYLNEENKSFKSIRATTNYNIQTKLETLNLSDSKLRQYLLNEAFEHGTHAIVSILWGANVFCTVELDNNNEEKTSEISGKLLVAFSKLKQVKIDGQAECGLNQEEKDLIRKTSITFFVDFVMDDRKLPQTAEEALDAMKHVPTYLKKTNDGKGVPLEFVLISFEDLKTFYSLDIRLNQICQNLDASLIFEVENFIDERSIAKQKLNDFFSELNSFSKNFPKTTLKTVKAVMEDIGKCDLEFHDSLRLALVNMRSGKAALGDEKDGQKKNEITNLLDSVNTKCSKESINSFLENDENKSIRKRLNMLKHYEKKKINYLGSLDDLDLVKNDYVVYVFF